MQSKKIIFCTWKTRCISGKVESFVRQQYLRYLYTTYFPLRSETWILDSSSITKLERFQNEIGRRILQLPKHFSGKAVRLALQWPSMSTRVLVRKLAFLCKLLSDQSDVEVISRDIFSSLASVDVYSISIIQQCRMLESFLGTSVLARRLNEPSEARSILSNYKSHLITKDFELLLKHSLSHKTAKIVASVAKTTSWCRLWDTVSKVLAAYKRC